MGLSRRFLNLIVDNPIPGARSLCCIDLTRQQFFNTATPAQPSNGTSQAPAADASNQKMKKQAAAATIKMGTIRLPSPSFSFPAPNSDLDDQQMHCFPAGDRRVICADQSGRVFLLEADTRRVLTMPRLHELKSMPISLFIPCTDEDGGDDLDGGGGGGGSLYVMERIPKPEAGCSEQLSHQFEALVYSKPSRFQFSKSWRCELLPPPPYVRDTTFLHSCPEISSYVVVGGGSHICISVNGIGTYLLDTASHTWSEVGKWTLPFHGKVEYVPELKLWFGFSADAQHLVAADLSAMDSQPQLMGIWKELEAPEEWQESQDPQVVNLGSGRFCIARFFHTRTPNINFGDEIIDQNFAILTGVEVVPHVHDADANGSNGKVELGMIKHKSRRHKPNGSDGTITEVF